MSATNDVVRRAFESMLVQSRQHKRRPPTVAAVAARVGISRSSMYRFHAAVVAQIRATTEAVGAKKQDQLRLKAQLLASQLKSERQLSAALARACAELAAQKSALQEQLADERTGFELRLRHLEEQLRGRRSVQLLGARSSE